MFVFKRNTHNPILQPDRHEPWRSRAVFNWSPIQKDGKTHVFYRAESQPDLAEKNRIVSSIGHASSEDEIHFDNHTQFIAPEADWDMYGCEDPRVTFFEGSYYIFYTALSQYPFRPEGIRVGVGISDDLQSLKERHLVTPFNAKAATLFPERIGGKIALLLTVDPDQPPARTALFTCDHIEELWSEDVWKTWYEHIDEYTIDPRRSQNDHVEIGATPLKTEEGWLLIYSHIQNYFSNEKIFGIEALLLDEQDPLTIRARTEAPIAVPQELYEKFGHVPNIIFPSGSRIKDDTLYIYYGCADTVCASASVHFPNLLSYLINTSPKELVDRPIKRPLLKPRKNTSWEARAVFNPAAFEHNDTIHIFYRGQSEDNTSRIGYAQSKDGVHIDTRKKDPIYEPRMPFEQKQKNDHENSGCEDPRITILDDTIYMLYTAYDQTLPRVAVSSLSLDNFEKEKWDWGTPQIISPEGIDDKDACLLSEKYNDQYVIIHRIQNHVCADMLPSLDFSTDKATKCIQIFGPRPGMWDSKKVGIGAPPHKTEKGWLWLYHGVSDDNVYRVGALLTSLDDPPHLISRTATPIFGPHYIWEKEGVVPNVVFPCGSVIRDDTLFLYYGAADMHVGVVTLSVSKLLDILSI
ncbi:MAG: hypothetical protein WDZ70_02765 [Candidatus Paceibacterota bacterium]